MPFVGHLGGPWGTMGDFRGSLEGRWGTMSDFCRSLGVSLGDNG